jgi:hypothetical protein
MCHDLDATFLAFFVRFTKRSITLHMNVLLVTDASDVLDRAKPRRPFSPFRIERLDLARPEADPRSIAG